MRGVFRMRGLFVRMRTKLKNNIHGQLFRLGVLLEEESDLFSLKGRAALDALDLADDARDELLRKLALLDDLDEHIREIEVVIRKDLAEDPRARIVDSLPGFGEITSHGFLAEMGELARFPNGRALAAYGGVLPLDNDSADKDMGKHTGYHCNRFLRWILLEAVTGATRKSPRMKSLCERVRAKNRRQPGKGRVAVARELAELAHLLLSRETLYTETPPPRPGSAEARAAARKSERRRKSFPLTGRKFVRGRKGETPAARKG
jgi:transposase